MKRVLFFISSAIVTGSPDHSILATDVETGGAIARLDNAHEWVLMSFVVVLFFYNNNFFSQVLIIYLLRREAINKIINLDESYIASGDDGGVIKVPNLFFLLRLPLLFRILFGYVSLQINWKYTK